MDSLEQHLSFAQLLNATIANYERQAGEIKMFGLLPQPEHPASA